MNMELIKTAANVARLGDFFTNNKAEANAWKKRMLLAAKLPLTFPDDWDSLSEDEKERRLNLAINCALDSKGATDGKDT
jgi:hypothetical protein